MTNIVFDHFVNAWGILGEWTASFAKLRPLVFRVRITNRCNLSCHYCYVGKSLNQKSPDLLNLSEWGQIIRHIPRRSIVDITGGEPLLAPNIEEILAAMLDRRLRISLITNGTVFKESLFKMIVVKRLDHFMVSFDGNENLHDKVRGDGAFKRSIRTANEIIKLKKNHNSKYPLVVAKVTYTEDNYEDVEALIDYLLNTVGFNGVTINLLFENQSRDGFVNAEHLEDDKFYKGNTMIFSPNKIESMNAVLIHNLKKFRSKIQLRPDMKYSNIKEYLTNPSKLSPKGCFKQRSVITMYSDGVVSPCDLGLKVGNIREINYNVRDVFRMTKMNTFFTDFKRKKSEFRGCEGCCLKKHEVCK